MRYAWLLGVAVCATYADGIWNANAAAVQCQFAGGFASDTRPQTIYLYHFKTRLKYTSEQGSSYNNERFLTASPPLFRPNREMNGWEDYRHSEGFDSTSGSLVSDHCIQSTEELSSSIVLTYANRKKTIDISDYPKTPTRNDGIKIIKSSSKEILDIGDQTAPDWLDLMQARIIYAPKETFLQIRLHNSGEQEAREHSLRLWASTGGKQCYSAPEIVQAKLLISSKGGKVSAASTDLVFGNIRILKDVELMLGACGGRTLEFDLGELPPVQPKQDYYINYVIFLSEPGDKYASNRFFFYDYPYMRLEVTGGDTFPNEISVQSN
jgi:hypothetical protein